MFKFLKSLFKQEPEKQDVNLNKLSKWFEGKTAFVFDDTNKSIKESFVEIKETLGILKRNISILENAEIKDADKIQPKVKQIVLGHRTSYARILFHFADSIEIPENIDYKEGIKLSFDIEEGIGEIIKTTIKSYSAVQHLFYDELEKVTKELKQLSRLSGQIKENIQKRRIAEIDKIRTEIDKLIDAIRAKKNIGMQLKEKGTALLNLENLKQESENRIKKIMESNDFLVFESFKKEINKTEGLIKQKESEVVQLFSPLEAGLRKFKRITLENEELIGNYADFAVKSLLKDKELRIINLLQNMKKNILSGELYLKEQKKKKTLEAIGSITYDRLNQIVFEHNGLLNQKENIEKQMRINSTKSKLKEAEYKIEHTMFKLDKLRKEIVLIEKKYNQLNIRSVKEELEKKIKEAVNIEAVILL